MATLKELLESPVATEEYAALLEAALETIESDNVRALALKQIGSDILSRVQAALETGEDLDNLVVLKNGKVYLEPGGEPIDLEQISAEHANYVLHTTDNVVRYEDGIPDDVQDFFAEMRD